jgi:glycerol-3-phosphate acyltransferase PlsY
MDGWGKSMIDILKIVAALALGYLLGSLNTAVIVGRLYGKDIREHGSKSAGLTNTLRVLGKPPRRSFSSANILKGIVACLIGLHLGVYVRRARPSTAQACWPPGPERSSGTTGRCILDSEEAREP